jgi:hypothetical protein
MTTLTASSLTSAQVLSDLLNPSQTSPSVAQNLMDNLGHPMEELSVINNPSATGSPNNLGDTYIGVYYVPHGNTFNVWLGESNSPNSGWIAVGQIDANADAAKIVQVPGSNWLVVTHEQWEGSTPGTAPQQVELDLYEGIQALGHGQIASTARMPLYGGSEYNGTPNIDSLQLTKDSHGYWMLNGSLSFHFAANTNAAGQITLDLVGSATFTNLFDPANPVHFNEFTSTNYNNALFDATGAKDLGDRDILFTSTGEIILQEFDTASPLSPNYWGDWHIAVVDVLGQGKFSIDVLPMPCEGNSSIGGPDISVLLTPSGTQELDVGYFGFSGPGIVGVAGETNMLF